MEEKEGEIVVTEKVGTDIDEVGHACCVVRGSDGCIYRVQNKEDGTWWDLGDVLNEAIDIAEDVSK